jgi:hypothetical protein
MVVAYSELDLYSKGGAASIPIGTHSVKRIGDSNTTHKVRRLSGTE